MREKLWSLYQCIFPLPGKYSEAWNIFHRTKIMKYTLLCLSETNISKAAFSGNGTEDTKEN